VNTAETALRAALTDAMRARDKTATSVLRTTIGALGNAEAVTTTAGPPVSSSEHVAGAHVGLGAAEAARRELTDADAWAVVRAEADDLVRSADALEASGRPDRAAELRSEAEVLHDVLRRTVVD